MDHEDFDDGIDWFPWGSEAVNERVWGGEGLPECLDTLELVA